VVEDHKGPEFNILHISPYNVQKLRAIGKVLKDANLARSGFVPFPEWLEFLHRMIARIIKLAYQA
jgi:hypothetical protein